MDKGEVKLRTVSKLQHHVDNLYDVDGGLCAGAGYDEVQHEEGENRHRAKLHPVSGHVPALIR